MATLIVDGQVQAACGPAKTLGDLVAAADDRSNVAGRIVTALRLDGVDEPAFRERHVTARPVGDFRRIEIESGTPADLAAECLAEAGTALEALADAAETTALRFYAGSIETANHELGEITGDLKALGVEMNAPVLLLSQLSRAVEARPDKRPMMSDLRDSGEIEQDADTVLLLYRPEYYFGPTMKVGEGKGKSEVVSIEGKAELLVSKQRNGETGSVPLHFHKEFTRFESISGREDHR